jgi:hypothetical protein
MAFSNIIEEPSYRLRDLVPPLIFKDIRSSSKQKSRRKRQCFRCEQKIEINEEYINHQFKYDGRIVTFSFHVNCFKK